MSEGIPAYMSKKQYRAIIKAHRAGAAMFEASIKKWEATDRREPKLKKAI